MERYLEKFINFLGDYIFGVALGICIAFIALYLQKIIKKIGGKERK